MSPQNYRSPIRQKTCWVFVWRILLLAELVSRNFFTHHKRVCAMKHNHISLFITPLPQSLCLTLKTRTSQSVGKPWQVNFCQNCVELSNNAFCNLISIHKLFSKLSSCSNIDKRPFHWAGIYEAGNGPTAHSSVNDPIMLLRKKLARP